MLNQGRILRSEYKPGGTVRGSLDRFGFPNFKDLTDKDRDRGRVDKE